MSAREAPSSFETLRRIFTAPSRALSLRALAVLLVTHSLTPSLTHSLAPAPGRGPPRGRLGALASLPPPHSFYPAAPAARVRSLTHSLLSRARAAPRRDARRRRVRARPRAPHRAGAPGGGGGSERGEMQAWTGGLRRVAKEAGKLSRKKRKRAVFTREAGSRQGDELPEAVEVRRHTRARASRRRGRGRAGRAPRCADGRPARRGGAPADGHRVQ